MSVSNQNDSTSVKATAGKTPKGKTPSAKKVAKKKTSSSDSRPSTLYKVFSGAGFQHIKSDLIEFKMSDRPGEIDHIFAFENVILICEETAGTNGVNKHFTNKAFFHKLISADIESFIESYKEINQEFRNYIEKSSYQPNELEIRHLYFSENADCDSGITSNSAPFKIIERSHMRYFSSLVETIGKTSKYEIFKYLEINLSMIGKARISGSGVSSDNFQGFALPSGHTHYPKGFAVVSFYADPGALLPRAYVLRRDGWDNPETSYQRFVRTEKLEEMREYLANNGKVFINNLIVTLPPSTVLRRNDSKEVIEPESLNTRCDVTLTLPNELGTVGIVDGQHRVLAYYEGSGAIDGKISALRQRQNLLVTGIIFPKSYSIEDRVKFEAELFLSINNTQTGVKADLRQELETIINPHTDIAIAKAVLNSLSKHGPLAGLIQTSSYDTGDKIKSASLVTYVIEPLIKTNSNNPFFSLWDPSKTRSLQVPDDRKSYIDFCAVNINKVLAGARDNLHGKWMPASKSSPGVLSTTTVGGLILCLRDLLSENKDACGLDFTNHFQGLAGFPFASYKGSRWANMAAELKTKYFSSTPLTAAPTSSVD